MSQRIEERLAEGGVAIECLRLPAALFGWITRLRARGYERGWLSSERLDVPVVSVGNLTTGGTGKTPFIAWLVRWFRERELWPGVLSRGYKAGPDGLNDEARLLAELFPGLPHEQDPDRVAGGSRLVDLGVDVILLDDGFQHRRLVRDLDLVLIDATRPWGFARQPGRPARGALLPRGLLRESPRAAARAHGVVLTRTDLCSAEELAALEAELEQLLPGLPRILTSHRPARLRPLLAADSTLPRAPTLELERLRGREVDLASGIGNPSAFQATIEALGARVATHRVLPDHHEYSGEELRDLGRARPLVVTAKDAVKLRPHAPAEAEIWILDVELCLSRGLPVLEALLEALPEAASRRVRAGLHAGLSG